MRSRNVEKQFSLNHGGNDTFITWSSYEQAEGNVTPSRQLISHFDDKNFGIIRFRFFRFLVNNRWLRFIDASNPNGSRTLQIWNFVKTNRKGLILHMIGGFTFVYLCGGNLNSVGLLFFSPFELDDSTHSIDDMNLRFLYERDR